MSEPTRRPVRDAAAVVLVREGPGGHELFWVRRSRDVALGGGFFAFPGGAVDPRDAALARELDAGEDGALRVAAVRELFEETGVLLARGGISASRAEAARRELLAGGDFGRVLRDNALHPELLSLEFAGRWVTPPFSPVRFDARFFVAPLPAGARPQVWPGELADGEWVAPRTALERWESGRALLHPPALHLVRCLAQAPPPSCLAAMARASDLDEHGVPRRIEFQGGVFLVPLRTPTLPPATHTNCYVVGGDELVVIDPGTPWDEPQRELLAFCESLAAEGRRLRQVLLTHAHHDHVGAAELLRERFGIPVRAHAEAAAQLEGVLRVDSTIEPDETIALEGTPRLRLRALHTPGHTRGHLVFHEENSGALFAGDLVAGLGTVVVDPPDGDMADYVASVQRVLALPVGAIHPAHGPTVPDGPAKLREYLAHRAERERSVVAALYASGRATAAELVPGVYADVAPALFPLAERSLLAVLLKLEREGRAVRVADERWERVRTGEA